MMASISVSPTYQGIEGLAHGGYLAGRFAELAGEPVRVTLRRPPPLDTPLTVEDRDGPRLVDPRGRTVMEAGPAGAMHDQAPTVTIEEARSYRPHPGLDRHPWPKCFMCGTDPEVGFGLRFSAPDEEGRVAGVWEPSGPLLPDGEVVPSAFVWAAVDCVTAWSIVDRRGETDWWPALTGQIAVQVSAAVRRGAPHTVAGRVVRREGRRLFMDAAITDADGQVCAHAEAVWVVVDPATRPDRGGARDGHRGPMSSRKSAPGSSTGTSARP